MKFKSSRSSSYVHTSCLLWYEVQLHTRSSNLLQSSAWNLVQSYFACYTHEVQLQTQSSAMYVKFTTYNKFSYVHKAQLHIQFTVWSSATYAREVQSILEVQHWFTKFSYTRSSATYVKFSYIHTKLSNKHEMKFSVWSSADHMLVWQSRNSKTSVRTSCMDAELRNRFELQPTLNFVTDSSFNQHWTLHVAGVKELLLTSWQYLHSPHWKFNTKCLEMLCFMYETLWALFLCLITQSLLVNFI